MNGSVFSKARYMNGVGFEILARTPVPKLPKVTPQSVGTHWNSQFDVKTPFNWSFNLSPAEPGYALTFQTV